MGKNKSEKLNANNEKGKTQELEQGKRISKGYQNRNPSTPK